MTNKYKKIAIIIASILVLGFIGYSVCLLIINPTDIYILTQGEIYSENETVGYIIREEKVIKDEENTNGIYTIAAEGQKVAKNEYIFGYYKEDEKEITNKINELDYQIQKRLEEIKYKPSADIKVIENQIEEKINQINKLNNFQEIQEYKYSIDTLIEKKINYIGELTEDSDIKKLINERNQYEKRLNNGVTYKKSEISGIVSYRVDGLEEELSPSKFDELTSDKLENLELKTGQTVASSDECGKIIDNFRCYIAVIMDQEMKEKAKVGNSVIIRISNVEEVDAKIIQINEESGNNVVIFELNQMDSTLINHRKVAIDVIWWKKSGYKIPNQAIITENVNGNELNYIVRNRAGVQSKLLVKIVKQTDKFSIIASYEAKELQKLGFDETDIKNDKKISNYDEIVINPNI